MKQKEYILAREERLASDPEGSGSLSAEIAKRKAKELEKIKAAEIKKAGKDKPTTIAEASTFFPKTSFSLWGPCLQEKELPKAFPPLEVPSIPIDPKVFL